MNPLELIAATFSLYATCAKRAAEGIWKNWIIIIASFLLLQTFYIASGILQSLMQTSYIAGGTLELLVMVGGFLVSILAIFLISFYYGWIAQIFRSEKLRFRDLLDLDREIFFSIVSVGFAFFILRFVVQSLTPPGDGISIKLIFGLGLFLVVNAIPEVISNYNYQSIPALKEAASFTIKNWIEWYIPLIIILLPWIIKNPQGVLFAVAFTDPLLPGMLVLQSFYWLNLFDSSFFGTIIQSIVSLILVDWFMLFRAHLFSGLNSGTRRQRIFKRKMS